MFKRPLRRVNKAVQMRNESINWPCGQGAWSAALHRNPSLSHEDPRMLRWWSSGTAAMRIRSRTECGRL